VVTAPCDEQKICFSQLPSQPSRFAACSQTDFVGLSASAAALFSKGFLLSLALTLRKVAKVLILAVVLAGCSRPPEQLALPEWERNPGLEPKPAGRGVLVSGEKQLGETSVSFAAPAPAAMELDASAAEQQYLSAAQEGQAWAMTRLGVLYARKNDPAGWQKALALLRKAAAQGDAEAHYELAGMAAAGRGLPASDLAAFESMKEAASRGLSDAQYQLAGMFLAGRGATADEAAAIEWARRAAEQGHLQGQLLLGRLLLKSSDKSMSGEGAQWLDRAAAAGDRQAALTLAAALARGESNLAKDESRAEQLVKPLADKGDVDAQFILAWLYTFAEKFADRRILARDYLQKAVEGGHPHAAKALEELNAPAKTD